MQLTKSSAADGFVVIDIADAATARGVVRCARKILQDGAVNLARSLTYTHAAFGLPTSGASAGINADGDARDAAVAAFVDELAPRVAAGLTLVAGKGVRPDELAPWGAPAPDDSAPLAAGVVAAAGVALDLGGARVGVEAGAPSAEQIASAFGDAGASTTVASLEELLADPHAVTVVGSKPGVLHHENVGALGAGVIVGAAGLSITARGLATARRQGAVVLPDFVSAGGPVLAAAGETDVAARVAAVVAAVLDHDEGPYLGGCYAAEEFLRSWTSDLPFGRPMA